jgi:hypothetical protein
MLSNHSDYGPLQIVNAGITYWHDWNPFGTSLMCQPFLAVVGKRIGVFP